MLTTECKAQDGETPMDCPPPAASPPDDAEVTANYRQSLVTLVDAVSAVAELAQEVGVT